MTASSSVTWRPSPRTAADHTRSHGDRRRASETVRGDAERSADMARTVTAQGRPGVLVGRDSGSVKATPARSSSARPRARASESLGGAAPARPPAAGAASAELLSPLGRHGGALRARAARGPVDPASAVPLAVGAVAGGGNGDAGDQATSEAAGSASSAAVAARPRRAHAGASTGAGGAPAAARASRAVAATGTTSGRAPARAASAAVPLALAAAAGGGRGDAGDQASSGYARVATSVARPRRTRATGVGAHDVTRNDARLRANASAMRDRMRRTFQDRSRRLFRERAAQHAGTLAARVSAGTSLRAIGAAVAGAGASAAGAVAAAAASAAAAVLPAVVAAVAVASVVSALLAPISAIVSAVSALLASEDGVGNGGALVASVAKAEYDAGLSDGTMHLNDPTYWEAIAGSGFSDASSTPWCACFVSWCLTQAGFTAAGGASDPVAPTTTFTGDFIEYYRSNPDKGAVYGLKGPFAEMTSSPQPGDIVCYGSDTSCSDHVGLVVAVYADPAGQTAVDVVEGNTGIGSDYGTGVNKHTYVNGNPSQMQSATTWWLGMDYWPYAIVCRPNYPAGAGSIDIPAPYGDVFSVTCLGTDGWHMGGYTRKDVLDPDRPVWQRWVDEGGTYDSQRLCTLGGRYLVACSSLFGEVGDAIDFYLDDGTVLPCIMLDTKNPSDEDMNQYGHMQGRCVLEFEYYNDYGPYHNPGTAQCHPEWHGLRTVSAENLGHYL